MRRGDRHQRSLEIANQLNREDSLHSFSKKHFDAVCLNPCIDARGIRKPFADS
jgi:hypothetical protein